MEQTAENQEAKSPTPKQSDHTWSFFFLGLIFILAMLSDQASKRFAARKFLNYNFAFSLPVPQPLIYIIYAVVIGAIVYYVFKNHRRLNFLAKLAWTLIFAGAACNIIERIYLGYVRDFIYISFYKWTGVYNLADGYIILGIVILILQSRKITKLGN